MWILAARGRTKTASQCLAAAVIVAGLLHGAATKGALAAPQVSASRAVEWLKQAVRAAAHVSYRATEALTIRGTGTIHRHKVKVVHRAPDDARREYLDEKGRTELIVVDDGHSHWQYSPRRRVIIFSASVRPDQELWQMRHLNRLLTNYIVSEAGEVTIEGRKARVVAISPRRGHHGPSKRLSVDVQTGLVLESELTSSDGKTRLASELSGLRFDKAIPSGEFAPPPNVRRQTVIYDHVAVLPLSALARHWKRPLMVPAYLPHGYRLESARLLRRSSRAFVHLRYFDGLNTLSVFEEPSRSRGPIAHRRKNDDVVHGAVATWQFNPPFRSLTWRENGLKLTLVADLPQEELLRIARRAGPRSR